VGDYSFGFNGKDRESEFNSGAYDFGARIHDARLGRWMSVDAEIDKAPDWTPYRFGFNNSTRHSDSNGKFEIDPALKAKYPTIALVLENAYELYYNLPLPPDLEKALEGVDLQSFFSDVMHSAFEEMSTLDDCAIQDMLTLGNGPLVSIGYLDTDDLKQNGLNVTELDQNNNPTDKNVQRGNGKTGLLLIEDYLLKVLEFELSGANDSGFGGKHPSPEDNNSAFFSAISTVFHEAIHWGRNETGVGNTKGVNGTEQEPGKEFEVKAFGKDICRTLIEHLNGGKKDSKQIENESE
jgi:RHS repeat-associated protein